MATSIRTTSRPLGDVDEHFADGAAFDCVVGGGGLLEGEPVQRQAGVAPTSRAPSAAAATTSATAASLTAAGTV